jgi:hypothetical protein
MLAVSNNVFENAEIVDYSSDTLQKRDDSNVLNSSKDAATAISIISAWSTV